MDSVPFIEVLLNFETFELRSNSIPSLLYFVFCHVRCFELNDVCWLIGEDVNCCLF